MTSLCYLEKPLSFSMRIFWVLFLILFGNSLGAESSIELIHPQEITHSPSQFDQSTLSPHHTNEIDTNLPDRTPLNNEVSITIDNYDGEISTAFEPTSHTPNAEGTGCSEYNIIPVALRNSDGSPMERSQEIPDCPICLDQCSEPYCQLKKCKHCFCVSCIDEWFTKNNTCPMCREGNGTLMAPSVPESQLPQENHGIRTWGIHIQNEQNIPHAQRQIEIKILSLKIALSSCLSALVVCVVILMIEKYWNNPPNPYGNMFYPPQGQS
ncbi:hypothetical protein PGT21_021070 [Puccinia graminis f. sp. tritici]|uniref:RING-type domain-containing protein n=1 Tax=Puccinia graminis f. sp. tritici TaxID=56615 RepID=A0A5B0NCR9_PUCGR|nr:hypothetical protein PGT21_021070 [Puccinia graminis f. sp. tritici]